MKKFIFTCALAILAAAACTSEPVAPEDPQTHLKGSIPVTLVVGEPGTRTELTAQEGEIHPWWSKGDGISVITYPYGGAESFGLFAFDGNLKSAGAIAQFSGMPDEPGTYIAVYPQQKRVYNSQYGYSYDNPEVYDYSYQYGQIELSYVLPSIQYPSLTSFDPDADLLISEPFAINYEDYDEELEKVVVEGVSFTRMNAIVKLVLNPQTAQLRGQTVRKVTIGTYEISSGGGEEPIAYIAPATRANPYQNEEEYANFGGLAGNIYVEFQSTSSSINYYGNENVTAEYTDETYKIGDKGAATYLITFPCILKNGERYDYDTDEYVYDDGLHVRVETDDFVIDRNVVLPEDGIALQPSRVTTLNIKLYDDGVNGTTIQTIGMTLNKESVSMKPGKAMQLEAQFIGINPDSDDLGNLVWTSSNTDVATVQPITYFYGGGVDLRSGNTEYTNQATVFAVSEGTATITASYNGQYVATCDVTVEIVPEQPSQMVDLGLPSGTKWAQWNLGAQSWDQEGDLYAWGETTYKDEFSWDNYLWAAGEEVLTKYTSSALFTPTHQIDHKFLLDLEDDAAYVNWGPDWYTPTSTQWEELLYTCSWSFIYDDDYNVIGCVATGPNENSIYFPSRELTYYFQSHCYMSSLLPKPNKGDYKEALNFYQFVFNANDSWSQELGSHVSASCYYYTPERGEEGAYIRPVSGGSSLRKDYTEDDLGAITVASSDGTVKARFPVYESEREQSYKNDPQYQYYAASAVILYSTDPNIEPCNYYNGHASSSSGSYQNGRFIRFNLEDYENNKVCSFVPEGMSGTIYYRAYYYSTVKKYNTSTTSTIVNEKWGVTRSVTIQ